MGALLAASNAINRVLGWIADASGWLLLVLMAVTCVDVTFRKLGVSAFPYTKFQELEWHLHTVIFALWLGFNYTVNAHPRVDSYTDTLSYRGKAWTELIGCLLFALPYTFVLLYYGWIFVKTSYLLNEQSESALGIGHRWIIKSIFYVGLWLLFFAIVSVMMRLVIFLFGGRSASEVNLPIGQSVSQV
jgi:TRAP-type mannitol/chloroaromatic compound transport system permease small subunit